MTSSCISPFESRHQQTAQLASYCRRPRSQVGRALNTHLQFHPLPTVPKRQTRTHTHTHSCSERRSNQHAYVTPHNPCCDAGLFAGRMKVMCPQEKQIVIVANTLNIRKMLDMISGLWPYLRRQRAAVDSLAWCDQVHALGRCASSCEEGTFWHHMRTGTQVLWCNQLQNPRYQHAGADPRLVCISFPLVCESASRGL